MQPFLLSRHLYDHTCHIKPPTPSNAYYAKQRIFSGEFFNPLLVLLHGADACVNARMAERVHLSVKPASALQTLPTSAQPVPFPGLLDCPISVHTCHSNPPHTPSKPKPAENAGKKKKISLLVLIWGLAFSVKGSWPGVQGLGFRV